MGLFDKIKKAVSGSPAPAPKTGGQKSGGQGQGGNRQGGNRSGGQGGNSQGQGGNRQGGNRQGQGGSGEGSGQGGNRRRGSRGGRGRGGQGGQGGQGGTQTAEGQERQGQGGQGGQGGNRNRNRGGQGQGGNRQGQSQGERAENQSGEGGQSSNARRRRRGGRGRGSGSGQGGQGGSNGGTRTVTRSDAAEIREKQEKSGEGRSSSQRRRSRGGSGNRSGSNRSGGGRGRERTRRGSSSSGSHRRVLDANERPKNPVKKQILINALDPNEIRVAIREQQQVVEVYVERKGKRSLAGNIYKGRVQNVLPGMEACFVDVGLERNGFLYVDEITPAAADSDQVMKVNMVTEVDTGADTPEGAMADAAAEHGEVAEGETLEMADAMAEEDAEKAAEATAEGAEKKSDGGSKGRGRSRIRNKQKIQDLLKQGQEILVQVVKDPMGTKGSRLTTQYSLAGRYLVYVPDGEGLGVSRRLEDAERNRLRDIVKQFELPWGGGLIVRTAAEGALEEDIAKDLDLLLRLHEQLMEKSGDARAPKLLYNEADLSLRIIRDLFNGEVEEVLVDDDRQYQRITNYLKRTSPELAERVRMHDGQRPLFESYGVEDAIKSTLSKRAELPSGGYLILDKTEAFHVIDVNSGRNVGKASLEETITKTNMEAAAEVVRQLRLRDLGGIIVIDFIDMNQMKNRDAVLEHFRTELSKDRTKTYLVEISPLGLVEMTRQNVSEGVREILTSTCRTCEGRGVQISPETHAIEVERALIDLATGLGADVEAVAIDAQPDVAKALAGNQSKQTELDKRAGKHIRVLADPDLTPNTFAVRATGSVAAVDATPEPLLRGTKHKVLIEKVDPSCEEDGIANIGGIMVTVIGAAASVGEEKTIVIAACSGSRAFATLVKPARRRRRRGGRGRKKTAVGVGAAGAEGVDLENDELSSDADAESGDEAEGDEFEEFEDDEEEIGSDAAAAEAEIDDERTEIPQRLVLLDEDDDADANDDEEDDDDLDEDEGDDDPDDEGDDGSDDDSDHGSDDSDGDDDGDDDDDPSGGSDAESDDDASDDSDSEDEDSHLDPTSAVDGADGAAPLAVRRQPSADDRDEPSIDADGSDDLLAERGITAIKTASVNVGNGTAPQAGAAPALGPDGQPRKRRRRGSRGGRNRNRSGANGQNRQNGSGGGEGSSSNSQSQSQSPSSSSDA